MRAPPLLAAIASLLLAPVASAQEVPSPEVRSPEVPSPEDAAALDVPAPPPSLSPTFPGGYRLTELTPSDRVEVGGGPPLTLGQVLSSVERHHPYLEAARQRVRAAAGYRLAAEGGFDLGLYASGWASPQGYYDWGRADVQLNQYTPLWGASVYAGWRIGRGGDVPDYYGNYETLDLGELRAGVRVPLWQDGPIDYRRSRLWQAEHYERAQEAYFDGTLLSTRLDAASYYWYWVAAGIKYGVYSRLLDLAEERDTQIAARVRAGAIPPIESLENRRVILSRRAELVSARRALERAAITLSLYLRRDDGAPRVPPPARVPTEIEVPEPLRVQLRREVEAAWGRRPELQAYDALIQRQRVDLDFAENRFAPRIDVGVQASVDIGAGTDDQQTRLGPPVVEGSVLFSMPFQFREARDGIQRSRAELAELRANARFLRDRIATEVQDAHSAVQAAEERLEVVRQSAEAAEAVAAAERRRFELGSTQLFIVNLREQYAAQAQAYLVEAQAELQMARARWSAATAGSIE